MYNNFIYIILTILPLLYGLPDNIICNRIKICDKYNICNDICEEGSLYIDPWLKSTITYQNNLLHKKNICNGQLLGSHNSGISMAYGYGKCGIINQRLGKKKYLIVEINIVICY